MLWFSSTDSCASLECRRPFPTNRTIETPFKAVLSPPIGHHRSRQSTSNFLLFWTSFALIALSLLLIALPEQAQAAALSIPVSEMLRETDEPFERDDRDYRPLQFGKRDATYRPLQFGKKSVYRPLQFGKRGGAHYWPVDASSDSRFVISTANLL